MAVLNGRRRPGTKLDNLLRVPHSAGDYFLREGWSSTLKIVNRIQIDFMSKTEFLTLGNCKFYLPKREDSFLRQSGRTGLDRWENVCGYKLKELSLDIREWQCPDCKNTHDREPEKNGNRQV